MADKTAQENRLDNLVKGNSPENRKKYALEAKRKGKKVIGLLCTHTPEEIMYAAGLHPWRITGTWDSDVVKSLIYRDLDSCRYCTHAVEAMLRGDLNFLDGIEASDWDDDRRRVFDLWVAIGKPQFALTHTALKSGSEVQVQHVAEEMATNAKAYEKLSGVKITEDNLRQAIKLYNKTRSLLMQLYELRKRPEPPITGAEVLGIVTASMVMDKADFNTELEVLLPYIESRKTGHKRDEPRVLVSSDLLDNPRFLEIIEGEGCIVAMDDLDTGSRYFTQLVDENADDPIEAIARRYCWRPADSIGYNWEEQIAQTIKWTRDWRTDGVIELYEEFSPARKWRAPLLVRALGRNNIPIARISRSYEVDNVEQLKTRVAAFLEMLKAPV